MKFSNKKILFWILGLIAISLFFGVDKIFAAVVNTGIEFGSYTGLVDMDIRIIISKIIRAALGLLGIIALGLIVWGGYEYMTAAGNEEQISKAKKILTDAAIGLAIILSALAIVQFVISLLITSITENYCIENPTADICKSECDRANPPASCNYIPPCSGLGCDKFYATSTPQGALPIKNVVVYIKFYSGMGFQTSVNPATVSSTLGSSPVFSNILIYKTSDVDKKMVQGHFEFLNNNTIAAFHPEGSCADPQLGIPAGNNDCFDKDTSYTVFLNTSNNPASVFSLRDTKGREITCDIGHPCESNFTTGNLVDMFAPTARITEPAPPALVENLYSTHITVAYTDDVSVSWLRFKVSSTPSGFVDLPGDIDLNAGVGHLFGTGSSNHAWTPSLSNPLKAQFVDLGADVYDLDNHSTTTVSQAKVLPAYCWNGIVESQYKEVTAGIAHVIPDCGNGSECGQCPGDSCNSNFDCAGSYCDTTTHTCVARPKILSVSPTEGAVGTYVTIKGLRFGDVEGKIYFGSSVAQIVSCPLTGGSKSWSKFVVVAKAPTSGSKVALELQTDDYVKNRTPFQYDFTLDNWGWKGEYTYTTQIRPGLSCLNPTSGRPSDPISAAGVHLGDRTTGVLKFGDLQINPQDNPSATNWSTSQINNIVTPVLPPEEFSFSVTVGSLESNPLPFVVKPQEKNLLPHIDDIDPKAGPVDTFITIIGKNFGTSAGNVFFQLGSGTIIPAVPPSSANCSDYWSPTQIIMKVPSAIEGAYKVWVVRNDLSFSTVENTSNEFTFTINNGPLLPGLCAISPDNGPETTPLVISGNNFGAQGKVEYRSPSIVVTSTKSVWNSPQVDQVSDEISIGTESSRIKVWSNDKKVYSSNSVNFKVQNCNDKGITCGSGICCDDGVCRTSCAEKTKFAVYGWSFSTGRLPIIPKVVEECAAGKVPSPTPSLFWNKNDSVCVNAQITIRFTSDIKDFIFGDSFIVQESSDKINWSNANGTLVDDGYWTTDPVNKKMLHFAPAGGKLNKNTFYRVLLTTKIKSKQADTGLEANMAASPVGVCPVVAGKDISYCFDFKTINSDDYCKLGSAVVNPDPFTALLFNTLYYSGTQTLYNVSAIAADNQCWAINAGDYDWLWNAGASAGGTSVYATIDNEKWTASPNTGKGKPNQDLTTMGKETPAGGEKVWAKTISSGREVKDSAVLNISVEKPKVIEYWPNCNAACTNAEVGFKFNQAMQVQNGKLKGNVFIMDCGADGICPTSLAYTLNTLPKNNENKEFYGSYSLQQNRYYKVLIQGGAGGVKSVGGSELDGTNDTFAWSPQFSWKFRTKTSACDIDKVKIAPVTSTVYFVGDTADYFSQPYGPPNDGCAIEGQRLLANSFNWSWGSINPAVATISSFDIGNRGSGSVKLTDYCGNGVLNSTANEECDSVNNCTPDCRVLPEPNHGTDKCAKSTDLNCCGNGGEYSSYLDSGEECDLGAQNGTAGSGCTSMCLLTTTNPISLKHCQLTIGGDALTKEARCVSQYNAVPVCGNGTQETGEECDGGDNCTDNCLKKTGFENGFGDGKIDPLQYATAVGRVEPDAEKQQKTQITAIANSKTGFAGFILQCGFSPVDGSCPPAPPAGTVCAGANACAVGVNTCCYPRPKVFRINPLSDVQTDICPNSLITVEFNQLMDESSFTSSSLGFFNIVLAESSSTLSSCPSGQIQVGREEIQPKGIWQNIKFFVRHLFGRPAEAQIFCDGAIDYSLSFQSVAHGDSASTTVSIILKEPLAKSQLYKLIVNNYVKSAEGVSINPNNDPLKNIDFTTGSKICQIKKVSIDPTNWLFSTTYDNSIDNNPNDINNFDLKKDADKVFYGKAYSVKTGANVTVDQELISLAGVYSWTYNWNLDAPKNNISLDNLTMEATTVKAISAAQNGMANVGLNVIMDENGFDDDGEVKSSTSTVQVFICENPWPNNAWPEFNLHTATHPEFGLGYFDANGAGENTTGGVNLEAGNGWTNFRLLYCRDAGKNNDISDDLPELRLPAALYHSDYSVTDPIFKEFFLTFKKPSETLPSENTIVKNPDSIGIRVYPNRNHLPLMDWYKSQPWIPIGYPVPAKVGNYEALQEGRTYYINGLNTSDSSPFSVYSNVYIFSFSDNPSNETLNIVAQLLNNLELNVNLWANNKNQIASLYRDFTRMRDLQSMAQALTKYKQNPTKGNGSFPLLTEHPELGTFLPGYTNSMWNSWQGVLGNLLGTAVPTDPQNGFFGCGSSTLTIAGQAMDKFEAKTCWNSAGSTFICPLGSHVYQYQFSNGTQVGLKADFELPLGTWNWDRPLAGICSQGGNVCQIDDDCLNKDDGEVCGTNSITFNLYDSCNNVSQTAATTCGTCIPGETRLVFCTPADSASTTWSEDLYPGQRLERCKKDCSSWEEDVSVFCAPIGSCGNGKIDNKINGEEFCDDGSNNGKAGYCNSTCTAKDNNCGNGAVDSGEVCDASNLPNAWWSKQNQTQCSLWGQGSDILGMCVGSGAKYNYQKDQSCSWNCQSFDYCGDGMVNPDYEQCEKSESCQVGTCFASVTNDGKYCEENQDCLNSDIICDIGKRCTNDSNFVCAVDADCTSLTKCGSYQAGKRYCKAPYEKKYKMFGSVHSSFQDATTTATIAPISDLTYSNTNKTCQWERNSVTIANNFSVTTMSCLPLAPAPPAPLINSCGKDADSDGSLLDPGEECDNGGANGDVPPNISNAPYGKSLSYCSIGCRWQSVSSGRYCGNGRIDALSSIIADPADYIANPEVCDIAANPITILSGGVCKHVNINATVTYSNPPTPLKCSPDCKSAICASGDTFCRDKNNCP